MTLKPIWEISLASRMARVRALLSRIDASIAVSEKTPPAATKPMANALISRGDL